MASHAATQTAIYGREREQAQLRDLLDAAIAGQGSLVLISGEAGIGKTTLVDDLKHLAREAGALILSSCCYEATMTPPYSPWTELLASYRSVPDEHPHLPAWHARPDRKEGSHGQESVFRQTLQFLAAVSSCQPYMLVLEDLHWSDPASIDLLRYITRNIGGLPVLLVVTYRDDTAGRHHPLQRHLPAIVRESRPIRLRLGPLDEQALAELIRSELHLPAGDLDVLSAHLIRQSSGNPLFASELLRSLVDTRVIETSDGTHRLNGNLDAVPVPRLVESMVAEARQHLSPQAQIIAEIAAVAGAALAITYWQELSDLNPAACASALDELIDRGIIMEHDTPGQVAFRHILIRDAIYQLVPNSRRRHLHRQVAERLAGQPEADTAAIGHHFRCAVDPRAVPWLSRAADDAMAWHARSSAAEALASALAVVDQAPSAARSRGWLSYRLALATFYDEPRRSLELLGEAAAIAERAGDRMLAAYARFHQGTIRCLLGDVTPGLQLMESSYIEIDELTVRDLPGDDLLACGFYGESLSSKPHSLNINPATGNLTLWLAAAGRFADAIRAGQRLHQELGDRQHGRTLTEAAGDASYGLAMSYALTGQLDEARAAFQTARAAYEAIGYHRMAGHMALAELLYVTIPYATDDLPERRRLQRLARTCYRRADEIEPGDEGIARQLFQWPRVLAGCWNAVAPASAASVAWLWIDRAYCEVMRAQGNPEQAWQRIYECLPEGPGTRPGSQTFSGALQLMPVAVELCLDARRVEQARRWLEAHRQWLDWTGAALGQAEHQLLRARQRQMDGDHAAARRHAEAALDLAGQPRQPLVILAAQRLLGELAIDAKRYAAATRLLDDALGLARGCETPYARALALLAHGRLRMQMGNLEEAAAQLDRARELCHGLEAQPALRQIEKLMGDLAQRRGRRAYPAGLSRREFEVLQFVASGLNNPAIAIQLHISRRTVERHVSSILRKTGCANRIEAARFAIDHQLA